MKVDTEAGVETIALHQVCTLVTARQEPRFSEWSYYKAFVSFPDLAMSVVSCISCENYFSLTLT